MLVKVKKNFTIYSKKGVFTFFENEILRVKEDGSSSHYELVDWENIRVPKKLFDKHVSQRVNNYTWVFGVLKASSPTKREEYERC